MDTSSEQAAQIVALVREGLDQRTIGRNLNLNQSTVSRIYRRFVETGSYRRRRGTGRTRATTGLDDRFIVITSLRNRFLTSVNIKTELNEVRGVNVCARTIRRRLKEADITPFRPANGPKLSAAHRQARLRFARHHLNWTEEQWASVLFTDECRTCLYGADGRRRVYRRRGERYAQSCIEERVPFGGGSCMVWGGISMNGRTELVFIDMVRQNGNRGGLTAHRYITEILEDHVVPYMGFIGENFTLMQDNARPHAAAQVQHYCEEVGIRTMNWPARSPDLNPIEHVWDNLKRAVYARNPSPTTVAALRTALSEEWDNIPQDLLKTLIKSMRNRLESVIRARGGNTPY